MPAWPAYGRPRMNTTLDATIQTVLLNPATGTGIPTDYASIPEFVDVAEQLLDNGFESVPLVHGKKRPAVEDWTNFVADLPAIALYPHCHTGLLTRHTPAADIDVRVADVAEALRDLATKMLGPGLIRIGHAPQSAI